MGLWRNKQQQQPHNRLPDRLTSLALSLSPTLLLFTLIPPLSPCAEYAKPAAAAQKSKVNIASLAYCRRRPLPSPPPLPLWRLQPFVFVPHSCGHSWCPTKLRSLLVRMFVLVVWLVSCLLLGSSWLGTSCGARSSAFGQLRFCSTRPHTKWQSLLSRRRRQSVAGRGQSSSQSNGPASVRERARERQRVNCFRAFSNSQFAKFDLHFVYMPI